MHSAPVPESDGTFSDGWKPTKPENPSFRCRKCQSDDVWYREWESGCGGFDDVKYRCHGCGYSWWVESADA